MGAIGDFMLLFFFFNFDISIKVNFPRKKSVADKLLGFLLGNDNDKTSQN